jgi:membrane-bound lytic murein transglycosylase MltF
VLLSKKKAMPSLLLTKAHLSSQHILGRQDSEQSIQTQQRYLEDMVVALPLGLKAMR